MTVISKNHSVRPIIESYKARYQRQRLRETQIIDEDITSIFEQTDDDLIQKEQEVVSWAISAYKHQR